MDPEIPTVSVVDLGIVRDVSLNGKAVHVVITPTYSGCPAMRLIEEEIGIALHKAGYVSSISTTYSPPWTTDWMSEKGREAMRASGIAPPVGMADTTLVQFPWKKKKPVEVPCPRCGSQKTSLANEFGSTACKALYVCQTCQQPFDYFKVF